MKNLVATLFIVLATAAVLAAQPTMPSAPTQAPLDGGLLVAAAAGGAYALRKLRTKK